MFSFFLPLGLDELLDACHLIRLSFPKAFEVNAFYEVRQRSLPRLLLMVGELTKLLRIHTQFSGHLNLCIRKMEPFACINPYPIFFWCFLLRHTYGTSSYRAANAPSERRATLKHSLLAQKRALWPVRFRVKAPVARRPPGSRAGLLPPSPLRTTRASFPACRSSLANARSRTRFHHGYPLAMDPGVTVRMEQYTVFGTV